jgi:hypothetical protein
MSKHEENLAQVRAEARAIQARYQATLQTAAKDPFGFNRGQASVRYEDEVRRLQQDIHQRYLDKLADLGLVESALLAPEDARLRRATDALREYQDEWLALTDTLCPQPLTARAVG